MAARTSAFSFKDRNENVSEIGRALNVSSILEGSVRKFGDRLRITVQLVNAADGYHLWSERYDRDMKDVFEVQDDISLAVVRALKVKLLGTEKAAVLKRHTENAEAYELYLMARHYWQQVKVESIHKGIELCEKAIELDPNYAEAYSGLADCLVTLSWIGGARPSDEFPKARLAAEEAVRLDPSLGEAYVSLSYVHFLYDWQWEQSEREMRRAIELAPGYVMAYIRLVVMMTAFGRTDEALAAAARTQELDPLAANSMLAMGYSLYFARRYEDAISEMRKAVEMHPHAYRLYIVLAWAHEALGQTRDAVSALERFRNVQNYSLVVSQLGYALAKDGRRDEGLTIVAKLIEQAKHEYVSALDIATVFLGLDDREQAFFWLERAFEERSGWLIALNTMPRYDGVRSDPRFVDLVRRMGLDQAKEASQRLRKG